MGLFGKLGDPPCPAGSICSGQAKTDVGRTYRTTKTPKRGGGTETVTQCSKYRNSHLSCISD